MLQFTNEQANAVADDLRFDDAGLVPAVVQDSETNTVLMMGFMNRAALVKTLTEGKVCFWSRSRGKFWIKGETSGMFLFAHAVRVNCENNSLLVLAKPSGPTCHTGHESCYYRQAQSEGWTEVAPVLVNPNELYKKS